MKPRHRSPPPIRPLAGTSSIPLRPVAQASGSGQARASRGRDNELSFRLVNRPVRQVASPGRLRCGIPAGVIPEVRVAYIWIGLRLLECLKLVVLHNDHSVGPAKDDVRQVLLRPLGCLVYCGAGSRDPSTHCHRICSRLDDNGQELGSLWVRIRYVRRCGALTGRGARRATHPATEAANRRH